MVATIITKQIKIIKIEILVVYENDIVKLKNISNNSNNKQKENE